VAGWRQNKVVGIIAAVVAVLVIGIIVKSLTNRGSLSKEQKEEIERINKMVEQEMMRDVGKPTR
jgi:septal ring-binding cell division protein DamX